MSITQDGIRHLIASGEFDKAEEQCRSLVEEYPDDADAKVMLGRVLRANRKYEEALTAFNHAVQQDSQNFEAMFFLAATYEDLRQYDKAIEHYRKALRHGQYQPLVHYHIGRIYANFSYEQRNVERARWHLRQATEVERPVEGGFLELSNLEQRRRAVYVLQNGLKFFPQSVALYEALASLYAYKLEDFAGCIETVASASENGVDTNRLRFLSALAYFQLERYSEAQDRLASVTAEQQELRYALKGLQSAILIEQASYDAAVTNLRSLIADDFRNTLHFAAHVLLMCCFLRQGDLQGAEQALAEIPDGEIPEVAVATPPLGGYHLDKYMIEALDALATQGSSERTRAKACGLRGLYHYQQHWAPESDTDWRALKDDLSVALKAYPHCVEYRTHLAYVLAELRDWVGAAHQHILAQIDTDEEQHVELHLENIYRSKAKFNRLLKAIDKILASTDYSYRWKDRFARFVLGELLGFLHAHQEYKRVAELGRKFEYRQLLQADVLFEMAYALAEIGDKKGSKSFYKAYLRDKGENSAACNNLGLLYEDEGNLAEAESLFRQALDLDPDNDKARKNLVRVQQKIRRAHEQRQALEKARNLYSQENITIKRAVARLYLERTEDDLILCNLDRLASLLNVPPSDADEWVEEFLGKKYFEEVTNHGLAFDGRILRVNPVLIPQIQEELDAAREQEFLEQLTDELSSANLDQKYGYNTSLIQRLSPLGSAELTVALERDLREAVFALATQCYKSALVLCGSIIEAILMDRLTARRDSAIKSLERLMTKEGKKITPKDKRIKQWTLDRLLDVAREENIVSNNLYHWGHGIRGFRNLVHPGVEQRRAIDVSRDNAEIAWHVVKRLLKELT